MNLQNQRSGKKHTHSVRSSGQSPPSTSPLGEKYFQQHQIVSSASGPPPVSFHQGDTTRRKEIGVTAQPYASSTSNFQLVATPDPSARIEFKIDLLVEACKDIQVMEIEVAHRTPNVTPNETPIGPSAVPSLAPSQETDVAPNKSQSANQLDFSSNAELMSQEEQPRSNETKAEKFPMTQFLPKSQVHATQSGAVDVRPVLDLLRDMPSSRPTAAPKRQLAPRDRNEAVNKRLPIRETTNFSSLGRPTIPYLRHRRSIKQEEKTEKVPIESVLAVPEHLLISCGEQNTTQSEEAPLTRNYLSNLSFAVQVFNFRAKPSSKVSQNLPEKAAGLPRVAPPVAPAPSPVKIGSPCQQPMVERRHLIQKRSRVSAQSNLHQACCPMMCVNSFCQTEVGQASAAQRRLKRFKSEVQPMPAAAGQVTESRPRQLVKAQSYVLSQTQRPKDNQAAAEAQASCIESEEKEVLLRMFENLIESERAADSAYNQMATAGARAKRGQKRVRKLKDARPPVEADYLILNLNDEEIQGCTTNEARQARLRLLQAQGRQSSGSFGPAGVYQIVINSQNGSIS